MIQQCMVPEFISKTCTKESIVECYDSCEKTWKPPHCHPAETWENKLPNLDGLEWNAVFASEIDGQVQGI